MKNKFKCGDCGAEFSTPIKRFDNGLKVCPACLSYITDDAWLLFLKRQKWLQRQMLKNNDMKRLFNKLFPVNTKTLFKEDTEED